MGFTGIFHLLSHSIFLIWHHFYTISFDFGVTLILFTPNYTIGLHLHHSRYSFRQIHFWHLIFCMSHFSDMIVDILSDLRIRMVFAPLRSVLVCIDKDKLCKQATLHQSKYRCRTNKATAYHYCFFWINHFLLRNNLISLIILFMYFKIALWMITYRTYFRCLSSYHNMPAVTAFPYFNFTLFKNFSSFNILKKCTISFLMVLLNLTYCPEFCCKLRESFFLRCFSKSGISSISTSETSPHFAHLTW